MTDRFGRMTIAILALTVSMAAVGPSRRAGAQTAAVPIKPPASTTGATPSAVTANGAAVPPDYSIAPEDVLSIVYWHDKDMTSDVTVRPDGKISLPLLNDVTAAGLTPAELRDRLIDASKKFFEDPAVTVVVKEMNSRKVFITGEVVKPGPYPMTGPTTVLQLISIAGGLREYADAKNIVIIRTEKGRPVSYRFNYKDVASRKDLRQNIELKPGDTIIVP
jgi:polysaccharide export outer membrane protein